MDFLDIEIQVEPQVLVLTFLIEGRGRTIQFSLNSESEAPTLHVHLTPDQVLDEPAALMTIGSPVVAKVGVLWGDKRWQPWLSRSLAVAGAELLVFASHGMEEPLQQERWWVRTYENVVPSLQIVAYKHKWAVMRAGPSGMLQESVMLSLNDTFDFHLDADQTRQERKRRPLLMDRVRTVF